jgi:peptidyl-prolyl cis-trans isomerase B (cyclophilin B)
MVISLGIALTACGPDKPTNPIVTLETNLGEIELEMFPDVAPQTVNNFLRLVGEGFYDSLQFQRVVPGFVIQAGDATVAGRERPEFTVPGEPNDSTHTKGRVGMALVGSDINSGSTQFYICLGERERVKHLDQYQFTIFGNVIAGWETVEAIAAVPTSGSIQRIMSDATWRNELLRLVAVDSADLVVMRDTIPQPERPLQPVRINKAYQKQ